MTVQCHLFSISSQRPHSNDLVNFLSFLGQCTEITVTLEKKLNRQGKGGIKTNTISLEDIEMWMCTFPLRENSWIQCHRNCGSGDIKCISRVNGSRIKRLFYVTNGTLSVDILLVKRLINNRQSAIETLPQIMARVSSLLHAK